MSAPILHPALGQLLRFQSAAKLRRLTRAFSTPRKRALSLLAVVLAAIFLNNMILSVFFRQPFHPDTLPRFLPLVLLAYGLWHVVKVVYRRPEQGIEWSIAERELVCAGPFQRRELLAYRFSAILTSAVLKAGCFTLLMLVDLSLPVVAFIGAFTALLFLDLFRMCVEIAAWGVSRRTYLKLRAGVLLVAAAALGSVLVIVVVSPGVQSAHLSAGLSGGVLNEVLAATENLRDSPFVRVVEGPFQIFAHVMTASEFSTGLFGCMSIAVIIAGLMAWLLFWTDGFFDRKRKYRERAAYGQIEHQRQADVNRKSAASRFSQVRWYGGFGPLAWRQAIGAYRYVGSLLIALGIAGGLSFMPVFVFSNPVIAILNVVASLAFYTFLLLPTSLKFDFRRDIDRMSLLKTLPIRPLSLVLGQLATPVLMASTTQLVVLALAVLFHPVGPGLLAAALLLLFVANVLIFALENLIFLLYPYRAGQEGLDVFLRTTLTFTAKGVLFAMGLALMYGWFAVSGCVAALLGPRAGVFGDGRWLFVVGTMSMFGLAAAATVHLLAGAYRRFDPSCDTPA